MLQYVTCSQDGDPVPISRRRFVQLAAAAGAVAPFIKAQAAGPIADGDAALGRRLVEVANDPAADPALLETLLTPRSLTGRPPAAWLADLAALRAASGGLEYIGVTRTSRELLVGVRTRRSGHERQLTAFVRRESPDRLSGFVFLPRPAAYPKPIIERPLSHRLLDRAIGERIAWSAARDEFSGAVRVVAPDGTVVHQSVHGRSEDRPIAVTDRFHLGSADKSFTALMVGRMIEAGRLRYDTRIAEVLPDYPNAQAAAAITVEHLLSHRAGLGALFDRKGWDGARRYDRVADLLPVFAAEPLAFAPGERQSYSNEGFVLLGAMLERIDGRLWWDQLAERIYRPAGMTRSAHFTADQDIPDRVIGARYADDDMLGLRGRSPAKNHSGWRGNSCGGGYSTVEDMCRYLAALRAGKLAAPATVARMTAPYPGGRPDYGMGFQCRLHGGRRLVGHAGGGPHSGIDGDSAIVWKTGWAYSVLGNYDAPFAGTVSWDIATMLAAQTAGA